MTITCLVLFVSPMRHLRTLSSSWFKGNARLGKFLCNVTRRKNTDEQGVRFPLLSFDRFGRVTADTVS